MRIVGGAWRGRRLLAPPGSVTRPTADRMRQALFDMLLHAPWGGRSVVEGARVLDAFAGTGALGLEALSRGASQATFMETDRDALAALRGNVAALGASAATILRCDVLDPPPGTPSGLVLLDPPYGLDLVGRSVDALGRAGWIPDEALVVAEIGRDEPIPALGEPLAERAHGAARFVAWRGRFGGDSV